jgi:hypothetical protein
MNEGEQRDEEKPRLGFQKKMGNMFAKATVRLDKALLDLKQLYDAMTEDEKNLLKEWIEKVVPLERPPVSNLRGVLKVELIYPVGQDEDIWVTGVPALAIKNAIEHWERGEAYNPGTFGEVGIG